MNTIIATSLIRTVKVRSPVMSPVLSATQPIHVTGLHVMMMLNLQGNMFTFIKFKFLS